MHSQLRHDAAGRAGGVELRRSGRPSRRCAWSSPVMTTAALRRAGGTRSAAAASVGVHRRRSGWPAGAAARRPAGSRPCSGRPSSAGCRRAPGRRTGRRSGSASCRRAPGPAQAGLPWRVWTTERARSYVNAAAWPPFAPTLRERHRRVRGRGAWRWSTASRALVRAGRARSGRPCRGTASCRSTMPGAGAPWLSTRRYAFASVAPASVRPSRPASCLSGRMAIRLPPPLTQSVSMETCADVSDMSPSDHDVVARRGSAAVTVEMSLTVNSFRPSARRISA